MENKEFSEVKIINNEKLSQKDKVYKRKNILFLFFFFFYIILLFVFLIFYYFYKSIKIIFKQKELLSHESNKLSQEKFRLLKKNIILNKFNFNKEYNLYKMLCPKEVVGKEKILLGDYGDGSYVLLNNLEGIKIAYSFGISNKISFDKALADKGIDVYMYDHTINNLPFENEKFHWKKYGICSESNKNPKMKTLNELLIENGHSKEKDMILKIDIEHNEWEILNEISFEILNKFKYIILELHLWNINKYELYINSLKKLMKNHQAFHIHCCNCLGLFSIGENPICSTFKT